MRKSEVGLGSVVTSEALRKHLLMGTTKWMGISKE